MESFFSNCLIQAAFLSPETWTGICNYWQWTFWLGVILGVAGSVVCLFLKRPQGL